MSGARAPLWSLFAVAAGASGLLFATGPLRDLDVYWHVRMGERILDTRSIPTHELWDFAARGRPWVPSAWLSEVLLALAHRAGGWPTVIALRLVLGAALLALVARAVLRGTDAVAGPLVFGVATLTLFSNVRERPQLFALVLLAALLPLVERIRAGTAPHPLAAAALGWLWASLHGSWPLLPALLGLGAACGLADRRPGARGAAGRLLVAAVCCVAGAALTPVGPALLLRPYVVARSTAGILEWQPTVLWHPIGAAYALLLAALATGWARSRDPVPAGELLWAGAVALLGLTAWRNVAFATVLLAPLVARRVSAVLPAGRRSEVPRWTVPAFGAAAAAVLVALTVASPARPADTPERLVAMLRAEPGEVRVLNQFTLGGYVTGTGGPHVSAAIDGRLDAFPPGYLGRYRAAMSLRGDWSGLLAELRPNYALLSKDLAMTHLLEAERGWRRIGTEGQYVLLAAS